MRSNRLGLPVLCAVVTVRLLAAYPSEERGTIDLSLSTPTALAYDATNDLLYSVAGETLRVIDLNTFALTVDSVQPYDISEDEDLTGTMTGIAADPDRNALYATQEGGKLLTYTLDDLAGAPTQVTLLSTADLAFVAVNPATGTLYIYDETNHLVYTYDPDTQALGSITLTTGGSFNFTVNAMRFVPTSSGGGTLVLTTSASRVFLIDASGGLAQMITVDLTTSTESLEGIAGSPDGSFIYVVNASDKSVHKISPSSLSVVSTIDLSANSNLSTIEIGDVTNPTGTYGFVSGSDGVSIFDTANDDVFDFDDTSSADADPLPLTTTGPMVLTEQGDLLISTGDLTVVSDNPFITISDPTFSSGTALGTTGSVTITFTADEAGTYRIYAGGTVDEDGTLLTDTVGGTEGSVSADTAVSVTFAYADNSDALAEGDNTIFVFVEDAEGNIGHRAVTVTVDTPPPNVVITSTNFGNARGYVTVTRLTASDISAYRAYVSTDAATILTTDTVSASTGQTTEGTDPTIIITGLDNGTTYFVAVDAIDTNGNTSAGRTTTINTGAVATVSPQGTFGPAGLAGERGCALVMTE